jgi:rod shape-determining protein MreC
MNPKKLSSRLHALIRAALVGGFVSFLVIYMIVARPEYRLLYSVVHTFTPVAEAIGDLLTWPVRGTGKIIKRIHNIAKLEKEIEELRAKLSLANANRQECDVALYENQKLARELGIARQSGFATIIADIIHDKTALHHETFLINRGTDDGVLTGMVAVSFENRLVGIVIDASSNFARLRALNDSDTNIAIRIAGSEVYGFMHGNGLMDPTIGFFSDHQFQGTQGTNVITSNISGVLPSGIYIGKIKNDSAVDVLSPADISRVMILKFNTLGNKYR